MKYLAGHIILISLFACYSCVQKAEEMVGPTMGSLDILADESLKDIIQQEEEIFERTYSYAKLDIAYLNEYDLFNRFLADSVRAIVTTRTLTRDEFDYFARNTSHPRQTVFATGAIAFITNRAANDTSYVYEEMISMLSDEKSGVRFVIENIKSGITQEILRTIGKDSLPGHIYALNAKKEVLDYIAAHDQAIGIIDYTDIGDSDSPYTKKVLQQFRLIGISRPVDSLQYGFVQPFQYNLQDRKYPFTRDLYFISTTGKSDVGTGFASFISGEIGQKIILKAGLLPKFQSERLLEINQTSDIKVIK